MRAVPALLVVLAALLLAACGGSSEETVKVGDATITVPGDVHGFYGEFAVMLDQFPYQRWYTRCVTARVKKLLSPAEAEALSELSESAREKKAMRVIGKAGQACEAAHDRPTVDPNASNKELDLLRADYVPSIVSFAEAHGLTSAQVACVEKRAAGLPDKQVVAMANGSHESRESILLSVFKPCAKAK